MGKKVNHVVGLQYTYFFYLVIIINTLFKCLEMGGEEVVQAQPIYRTLVGIPAVVENKIYSVAAEKISKTYVLPDFFPAKVC